MITLTKSAFAAALLAVMAVSAQAQQNPQGATRQIQVLAAPDQGNNFAQPAQQARPQIQVLAQGDAQVQAPAQVEQVAPVQEAAPIDQGAPQQDFRKKFRPKVVEVVEAPVEQKFIEKKFEPKHARYDDRSSYRPSHGYSYGSAKRYNNHCH